MSIISAVQRLLNPNKQTMHGAALLADAENSAGRFNARVNSLLEHLIGLDHCTRSLHSRSYAPDKIKKFLFRLHLVKHASACVDVAKPRVCLLLRNAEGKSQNRGLVVNERGDDPPHCRI